MSNQPFNFTNPDSEIITKFEEEIVYFYGAKNTDKIKEYYIEAIGVFENSKNSNNTEDLRRLVVPYILKAYLEIKQETTLSFDHARASNIEFDLIYAQSEKYHFEDIVQIMILLYQEVFQASSLHIQKAAMLRTFLYQYKISLLAMNENLQQEDMELLKKIARQSELELELHQLGSK